VTLRQKSSPHRTPAAPAKIPVPQFQDTHSLLADRAADKLGGVHLLGPAVEMINVFAVAMKGGKTTSDLKGVLMVFPTFTSDIRSMV